MADLKQQILLMSQYGGKPEDPTIKTWDQQLTEQGNPPCTIAAVSDAVASDKAKLRDESRYLVYALTPRTLKDVIPLVFDIAIAARNNPNDTLVLYLEDETEERFEHRVENHSKMLCYQLVRSGVMVFLSLKELTDWLNNPRSWIVRDEVWTPFTFMDSIGVNSIETRNMWDATKDLCASTNQSGDVYDAVLINATHPDKFAYGIYVINPETRIQQWRDAYGFDPTIYDLHGLTLREFFIQNHMEID